MALLDTSEFSEFIMRSYLGKYQSRFKSLPSNDSIMLITDPQPLLVTKMLGQIMVLYEYIDIEQDDPYYGIFDHYQIEIANISIDDPYGNKKVEAAVSKLLLAGTWNPT